MRVYRARVPASPNSLAAELLREHVARDAPAREASVARFMALVCGLSAVSALVLMPILGSRLSLSLAVTLLVITAYYVALIRLISRGWFHPSVSWLNVAIEVSAPSVIFLIDVGQGGVEYALTAPPIVIWGTLIALSGLRGNKWLTIGAGALASVEYALLYALIAVPRLDTSLVTLRPPLMITRIILLFSSAVLTAIFVNHLNRRAEEALAAVRAKDVFGKYLLHERVGMGGMAEVYRATYNPEGGFQKVVALKRVLPQYVEDETFIEMFREEAALCSQFGHPNVVQVFDFGKFGDSYFLAMEFLDGPALSRVLRAYKGVGLPIPAVIHLAVSLCEALQYVHERRGADGTELKLVHRDLNPPNVLLSRLGEVKLTDFGIARSTSHIQHTEAGTIKGKPGYLAPEQAETDDFDSRVDLFALGVTLWECTTGEALFTATDAATTLSNVFEKQVPPLRSKRAEVPQALDTFVRGLLEREVTRRIPSARAALQLLRPLDDGSGGRSLAAAIELAMKTTVPSSASLKAAVATPAHEAATLPGRN